MFLSVSFRGKFLWKVLVASPCDSSSVLPPLAPGIQQPPSLQLKNGTQHGTQKWARAGKIGRAGTADGSAIAPNLYLIG